MTKKFTFTSTLIIETQLTKTEWNEYLNFTKRMFWIENSTTKNSYIEFL